MSCPGADDHVSHVIQSGAPSEGGASDRLELEVVFASGRGELIALAKSILLSAGIDYCVEGEEVQDLFGWGRFPGGLSVLMGTVKILVRHEDAGDAAALLADLGTPLRRLDEPGDTRDPDESEVHRLWRDAPTLARIVAGAALGVVALEVLWSLATSILRR